MLLARLWPSLLLGCDRSDDPPPPSAEIAPAPATAAEAALPEVAYRLDPAAGDPAVPAELGGPGFTGEGWETDLQFPGIGVADAPQGGSLSQPIPDWPATLRVAGQHAGGPFGAMMAQLCYEPLLDLNPVTLEYAPRLATHWQISADKLTYRFRINPAARWSDGSPVTADDAVASWRLRADPASLDPSGVAAFGRLRGARAVSPYIVEVQATEPGWRSFLDFATMPVLAAREAGLPAGEFLDRFQAAPALGSGPYILRPADVVTGSSLTFTRRADWWAEDNPAFDGLYNLGAIRLEVVADPVLAFEKLKKGELDYYAIPKAQWWAEDVPKLESVRRGLLVPLKVYTDAPVGTPGIALNLTRPPLDDARVRRALQLLYDRPTLIQKLYFGEYEPLRSYWHGGLTPPPAAPAAPYDEAEAVRLLEEAGWKEINGEGYRTKGGQELRLTVTYTISLAERAMTVFQESCKKAGIRLEMQQLTKAAALKLAQEKAYDLMTTAGDSPLFPDPTPSWHSRLAREPHSDNITGLADPRVDALCEAYDREPDPARRASLLGQLDALLIEQVPYVLGWYGPAQRVVFWNRFGMPPWGAGRFHSTVELPLTWWADPSKERELAAARADAGRRMDPGPREARFWETWR